MKKAILIVALILSTFAAVRRVRAPRMTASTVLYVFDVGLSVSIPVMAAIALADIYRKDRK